MTTNSAFARTDFELEDDWIDTPVYFTGFDGQGSGLITESGTVRIGTLPQVLDADAVLVPPNRGGIIGKKFVKWCQLRPPMEVAHKEGKSFEIEAAVNPFAGSVFAQLDSRTFTEIENLPSAIEIEPLVTVGASSLSRKVRIRPEMIAAEIRLQILAQAERIKREGRLNVKLVSLDSFACDLALGDASLSFRVSVRYEAGVRGRSRAISEDQLRITYNAFKHIQDETFKTIQGDTNLLSEPEFQKVLTGYNLADALANNTVFKFQTFGLSRLAKLRDMLVDPADSLPKPISIGDFQKLARSFDETVVYLTDKVVNVRPKLILETEK